MSVRCEYCKGGSLRVIDEYEDENKQEWLVIICDNCDERFEYRVQREKK